MNCPNTKMLVKERSKYIYLKIRANYEKMNKVIMRKDKLCIPRQAYKAVEAATFIN